MARMVMIIVSALVFSLVGLAAAGMVALSYDEADVLSSADKQELIVMAFAGPLVGAGVGLLIGCIAAYVGRRTTNSREKR